MEQAPYWITATSYVFSLLPSLLHSNIRFLSALLLAYTPPVFASGVDFSCAFDVHKPHTSSPLAHMAIGLVHPVSNVSSFHFRSHPSQHFLPTLIRLPTFSLIKVTPIFNVNAERWATGLRPRPRLTDHVIFRLEA